MSLLSTSSTTQQKAFLYENHYPQPIIIKPNSQICLQKFIHYRGALYEVTTQNNSIGFRLGTGGQNQDVSRFNTIPLGSYDAIGLASAVTLTLNAVNQQQNFEWLCSYTPPAASGDPDVFQIQYSSIPTPDINSGSYNSFESPYISLTNQNKVNEESKITYNGSNALHTANVISKRSTLMYLGEQTWNMIQPNITNQRFQPLQVGLVRNQLSDPNNPNVNLQFNAERYDIALEFDGEGMAVTYGRQRQGSIVGTPNWFQSDVRRDLGELFDFIFKPAGTFSPHTKLQTKFTIYASSQTSRRVFIQLFKKDAGETTYTPLPDGFGGNSPIGAGTPLVKTTLVGGDSFPGLVFDSNDPSLNDSGQKIAQHYPKLSVAPFFPTITFQKSAPQVAGGYDLDSSTWINNGGVVTTTFTPQVNNANGYTWKTTTDVPNILDNCFWLQVDPLNFDIKGGDVPMTDPPLYTAVLNPIAGNTNPNGQISVKDGITGAQVQSINFSGTSPIVLETVPMSIFTQGIFNGFEPIPGLSSESSEVDPGSESGGLLTDLSVNARLFLRGAGGGQEADVGNLLGFSNNEEDFGGGASTGASVTSDQDPDQTANNNTLHISIPEMPLVKSFEGENSAEGKSIAIIPREEFGTGEIEGSLVYVAPFENWIDINNGQELNVNLLTTLVRNADGSLADNLVRETQAVFKLRQDPMKVEEDAKLERFREMAESISNTINTGLTSLITPQQLIGS